MSTTDNSKLRQLGYMISDAGVSQFQRDYNRVGARPLHVTGKLDAKTREALELAHSSAEVFTAVRDQGKR